ncbi:hypothetical protein DNTS_031451 [Danionella cerebrum]|uniref:Lactose synthase B protein n=1 Tax=Danionella cerebrum TaxID=2873325 RepID=A0A553QQ78_9TELE|nr:hypothetical protein DNTS_031451 [Danionella translucida]
MKMSGLLLVSIMMVGLSNAVMVTKCDLKQQLQDVLLSLDFPDIVAKELSSNFNTSAIKTVPAPDELNGSLASNEKPELWTLYGLFQFNDHVICSSSEVPSSNICQISCNKLIDSDITDDMNCIKTLVTLSEMPLISPLSFSAKDSVYFADCPQSSS